MSVILKSDLFNNLEKFWYISPCLCFNADMSLTFKKKFLLIPIMNKSLISKQYFCTDQSCEVSHRERVPARSASGQVFYTAHFYMLAQKVYTMRRDLRYNFQERQDTKVEALSTVVYNNTTWWPLTRVDRSDEQQKLTTWSEWIQQQVPLSPTLWCASYQDRSGPRAQGWIRGWPHWGVWLAHKTPGSHAPVPTNGPASGSSGKRNVLDENIGLKPKNLDD